MDSGGFWLVTGKKTLDHSLCKLNMEEWEDERIYQFEHKFGPFETLKKACGSYVLHLCIKLSTKFFIAWIL